MTSVWLYSASVGSNGPLIVVSRREIERAQKMALAFRLPESVALRWPQMRYSFSVDMHLMLVMPGKQWSPEKWRILWNGSERWAVKGSPNRSTFYDAYAKRTETLTQDEIAARMQALKQWQLRSAHPADASGMICWAIRRGRGRARSAPEATVATGPSLKSHRRPSRPGRTRRCRRRARFRTSGWCGPGG